MAQSPSKTTQKTLRVRVRSNRDQNSDSFGEVTLEFRDSTARVKRAGKALLLAYGLALVAVFIPMLHFILVPAFLIGGTVYAGKVWQQKTAILGGHANCPACSMDFQILKGPNRWPIPDVCAGCHEDLTIEEITAT